jgi:hypothetical protein
MPALEEGIEADDVLDLDIFEMDFEMTRLTYLVTKGADKQGEVGIIMIWMAAMRVVDDVIDCAPCVLCALACEARGVHLRRVA